MILIFDYFETLLNSRSIDFNRGLRPFWESYYKDKCEFEDMKAYGEELFKVLLSKHEAGEEYPFVKEELPLQNMAFQFLKPTLSQPKTAICNFEKSFRSHSWTRFAAPKSYQEFFTRMI